MCRNRGEIENTTFRFTELEPGRSNEIWIRSSPSLNFPFAWMQTLGSNVKSLFNVLTDELRLRFCAFVSRRCRRRVFVEEWGSGTFRRGIRIEVNFSWWISAVLVQRGWLWDINAGCWQWSRNWCALYNHIRRMVAKNNLQDPRDSFGQEIKSTRTSRSSWGEVWNKVQTLTLFSRASMQHCWDMGTRAHHRGQVWLAQVYDS